MTGTTSRSVRLHGVVRCDYRLAETEIFTFDPKNDACSAQRLPPARWLEGSSDGGAAPPRRLWTRLSVLSSPTVVPRAARRSAAPNMPKRTRGLSAARPR